MNTKTLRFPIFALLVLLTGSACGQNDNRAPFQFRNGYEEARLGSGDVTINTRDGAKTLHISLAKLRVEQSGKPAAIRLPGAGLALLQHTAGTAKVVVGRESFEPLEGEWLRLPLPVEFTIGTDNDTITLDLLLIEERGN